MQNVEQQNTSSKACCCPYLETFVVPLPEHSPVSSTGSPNCKATTPASAQIVPAHAARERKWPLCLTEEHVGCEGLCFRRQGALSGQPTLGFAEALYPHAEQSPYCTSHLHLHGLVLSLWADHTQCLHEGQALERCRNGKPVSCVCGIQTVCPHRTKNTSFRWPSSSAPYRRRRPESTSWCPCPSQYKDLIPKTHKWSSGSPTSAAEAMPTPAVGLQYLHSAAILPIDAADWSPN